MCEGQKIMDLQILDIFTIHQWQSSLECVGNLRSTQIVRFLSIPILGNQVPSTTY